MIIYLPTFCCLIEYKKIKIKLPYIIKIPTICCIIKILATFISQYSKPVNIQNKDNLAKKTLFSEKLPTICCLLEA